MPSAKATTPPKLCDLLSDVFSELDIRVYKECKAEDLSAVIEGVWLREDKLWHLIIKVVLFPVSISVDITGVAIRAPLKITATTPFVGFSVEGEIYRHQFRAVANKKALSKALENLESVAKFLDKVPVWWRGWGGMVQDGIIWPVLDKMVYDEVWARELFRLLFAIDGVLV